MVRALYVLSESTKGSIFSLQDVKEHIVHKTCFEVLSKVQVFAQYMG